MNDIADATLPAATRAAIVASALDTSQRHPSRAADTRVMGLASTFRSRSLSSRRSCSRQGRRCRSMGGFAPCHQAQAGLQRFAYVLALDRRAPSSCVNHRLHAISYGHRDRS
jgi:hypothetical protein